MSQERWTPNVITCPECRTAEVNCDSEGACRCVNDHAFWDTNSPEWQVSRRLEVALEEAREAKAEIRRYRSALSSVDECTVRPGCDWCRSLARSALVSGERE